MLLLVAGSLEDCCGQWCCLTSCWGQLQSAASLLQSAGDADLPANSISFGTRNETCPNTAPKGCKTKAKPNARERSTLEPSEHPASAIFAPSGVPPGRQNKGSSRVIWGEKTFLDRAFLSRKRFHHMGTTNSTLPPSPLEGKPHLALSLAPKTPRESARHFFASDVRHGAHPAKEPQPPARQEIYQRLCNLKFKG